MWDPREISGKKNSVVSTSGHRQAHTHCEMTGRMSFLFTSILPFYAFTFVLAKRQLFSGI
jgi:hypothetical protein